MNYTKVAGLCRTSPALVKDSIDAYRGRAKCRPVIASIKSPMSEKNVSSGTRIALVLGAKTLADCADALKDETISLSLVVIDCEYTLKEIGVPLLDENGSLDSIPVGDWIAGRHDHADLKDIALSSPKAHIMDKLERNDRSVARMMLELTLPVSSKKVKAAVRQCFLEWLSSPRTGVDSLAANLSPHIDASEVAEPLEIIGSDDFKAIKRKCGRLATLLRKNPTDDELERWITRNAVLTVKSPSDLPAFDVRYLVSVWRDAG